MGHDFELRHCRAFVSTVDHGGPTRAARVLGVAQSTVSEALLALERAVGAPLFVRATPTSGTPRALTAAGEALLPRARSLLVDAGDAVAAARQAARADDATATTLRLGAAESVSTYLLPALVADLGARWPLTDVQVSVGLCDDLRREVSARQLDAALVIETRPPTDGGGDLTTRVLAPARMAVVGTSAAVGSDAARSRGPAGGAAWTRAHLQCATLLTSDPSGAFRSALQTYFADLPLAPRLRSAGSVDAVKQGLRAEATLRGTAAAKGTRRPLLGVLPAHAVRLELRRGDFAEVPLATPLPAVFLNAVTRTRRATTAPDDPLLTALIDALATLDLR